MVFEIIKGNWVGEIMSMGCMGWGRGWEHVAFKKVKKRDGNGQVQVERPWGWIWIKTS